MERLAGPASLIDSLARTVTRVEAAAAGLSRTQREEPPGGGGWSPNEILWHVRAAADVYGEHISRILDEDQPRWRHVSPRARMKQSRYDQVPFTESLAAFARQRADLVARLRTIAPDAWERSALVRVRDREQRLTLHERVRQMTAHEAAHCSQIEDLAAALRSRR